MGLSWQDVAEIVGFTLIIATVARLIGFLRFTGSILSAPGDVAAVLKEFWSPILLPWFFLAMIGILFAIRTSAGGSESEDPEQPFDEVDLGNSTPTKIETLERTLDRAESVLQGQLEVLADTDDKAVRTVRVEVILLGAVVSAAQIASKALPMNMWMRISGVLFVGSIITGIFTYSTSIPDFGPGPSYVRERIQGSARQIPVYLQLLQGYNESIAHNRRVVNESAQYLFLTQALLIGGIICGGIGIAITL